MSPETFETLHVYLHQKVMVALDFSLLWSTLLDKNNAPLEKEPIFARLQLQLVIFHTPIVNNFVFISTRLCIFLRSKKKK